MIGNIGLRDTRNKQIIVYVVAISGLHSYAQTLFSPTVVAEVNGTATVGILSYSEILINPTVTAVQNASVTVALQSYSETLIAPTVIDSQQEVVASVALQAYSETISSPIVTAIRNETISVALQSYTESLIAPTVTAVGDISVVATVAAQNFAETLNSPVFVGGSLVTTWDTTRTGYFDTTPDNQIAIPLSSIYDYDFVLDWGDGSSDVITTYNDPALLHTYAASGIKTLTFTGIFPKFEFLNEDAPKITAVNSWGDIEYHTDQSRGFGQTTGLSSFPATPSASFNLLTKGQSTFYKSPISQVPSGMTFPNLELGDSMFSQCNLTSLPAGMELNALTNGSYMFDVNSLTALPDNMTLPNLIDGYRMFRSNSLTDLPAGMTLSKLTDGQLMFWLSDINIPRYSQLLVDMESLNPNNSVSFHGGNSNYDASGKTARDILIGGTRNWIIDDGSYYAAINPDGDDDSGIWTVPPLWSKVNDYSDATSIMSTQTTNPCAISLETLPADSTGTSVLKVRASKPTGGSNPDLTVEFRNGTTVMQSITTEILEGFNDIYLNIPTILLTTGNYNVTLSNSTGGNPSNRRESIVYSISLSVPQ